ncbi:MAG: hemolysin [Rhizobacter sp.]|nr:hemolysin [Rhizobacter sp.]
MNATVSPSSSTVEPAAPAGNGKRKFALSVIAGVVVLGAIAYGAYYALVLNHYETTDNAYVQGNVVQITPQVGGTVLAINADDTDFVKAGQLLVKLDAADAQVALDQAEAQLAQAVREVRTLYVNNNSYSAQISLREADLARARADLARAQDDVNRRAPLVASGAVGQEEFNHVKSQLAAMQSAVNAAQSGALAAREALASNQSLTEGTTVEEHPNVQRAAARVREAYLALKRVDLPSPIDGYVARRSVQVGQRIAAGTPLMSVIPLNQVWVDANFKESQLANLRLGQGVTLEADVYGKKIEYTGTIQGLGAGTGSAFALLPAQNATGNWIKVVQRVPVRIALDPKQLQQYPLRVGLSMDVRVDVKDTSGKMLADVPRAAGTSIQTTVFDQTNEMANAEVDKIIASNMGRARRDAKASVATRAPSQASRGQGKGDTAPVAPAIASASAGSSDPTVR